MNHPQASAIEVELKFPVANLGRVHDELLAMHAVEEPFEFHEDVYFRHPCRDFAATREALRIRRVLVSGPDPAARGEPRAETRVTYKGPHLPGGIKARHELEWSIESSDTDGKNFESLLRSLGFEPVAAVRKTRRTMSLLLQSRTVLVGLDDVESVGDYVEVETIAADESEVPVAREVVGKLAADLQLGEPVKQSYLSLLLSRTK